MTDEWRERRWGDLATLEYGKGLRGYQDRIGLYPVYGTNGVIGSHDEPLCLHPGVIIGRKGAYRGVHYSKKPFFVIDTAFYLKPKTDIDLKWAYYQLLTQNINSMDSGSAIPSTSRDAFYNLPVKVPSLPEQKAIASILGALDDKIELNRKMNETLEAMARAIFKSWFVDFAPIPGFGPHNEWQDSPLGKIPEGWRVETISDILELAYGKGLKEDVRQSGKIPVYGSNGQVGWHNESLVKGPGIVVGRKGNPGVVTWVATDFFPIDTTFYVVSKGIIKSMYYLFHTLRLQDLASLGADSAVPGLNRNMAYMSKLVVPPEQLISAFDKQIEPLANTVHHNNEQSLAIASIRDTLLPKLLSGEIRVKDAERFAEKQA